MISSIFSCKTYSCIRIYLLDKIKSTQLVNNLLKSGTTFGGSKLRDRRKIKQVVINGGSSGIGTALAKQLFGYQNSFAEQFL